MLNSIVPSAESSTQMIEEARILFQEARQEYLRYVISKDPEAGNRAIRLLNRIYLLHLECGFEPAQIGTNHRELTSIYQRLGYFLISNTFASFFLLQEK